MATHVNWLHGTCRFLCQLCFFFYDLSVHISFAVLCATIGLHAYLCRLWVLQGWIFVYSSLHSPRTWPGLTQRMCSVNVPSIQSKIIYCNKCLTIISSIITKPDLHCGLLLWAWREPVPCSLFLVGSYKNKEFYFPKTYIVFFLKSFIKINFILTQP